MRYQIQTGTALTAHARRRLIAELFHAGAKVESVAHDTDTTTLGVRAPHLGFLPSIDITFSPLIVQPA
jgi:hypothetical protein